MKSSTVGFRRALLNADASGRGHIGGIPVPCFAVPAFYDDGMSHGKILLMKRVPVIDVRYIVSGSPAFIRYGFFLERNTRNLLDEKF